MYFLIFTRKIVWNDLCVSQATEISHVLAIIMQRNWVKFTIFYPDPRISVNAKYPLEATKALRTVSKKAGFEAPDQIWSTLLRKHIAMMSQLVNLSSAEMHQLANFMGHNLNIHMDYYRLPDDIEQN